MHVPPLLKTEIMLIYCTRLLLPHANDVCFSNVFSLLTRYVDYSFCLCFLLPEKFEKEVDIYANLSDEKAFVFSVALAEINRKILGQRLIL